MIDMRPILVVVGLLIATLGVTMLIPALVDLMFQNDDWQVFAAASMITTLTGLGLFATGHGHTMMLSLRQAVLMTVLAWIFLPLFASFPLLWSGSANSFTDAFFEAMSGITTTGATVIVGLDDQPPGVLMWRSLLQWLGGLGVIVMAVAVMPMLRIGGMQLFKTEAFDTAEKILPRATQISGMLTLVFAVLTFVCAVFYALAGMNVFDAICHAMTTVATGGFSTKDASIGHYQSELIDFIAIIFMLLGSLPFLLYVKAVQGSPKGLFEDSQIRTFLALVICFTILMWQYEEIRGVREGPEALLFASFNVVSVITGTGFATDDYNAWGPLAVITFLVLTFLGGCAGSTSCGMKTFRIEVAFKTLTQHIRRLAYPNGIFILRYNGRPLDDTVVAAVMSFIFLYLASFGVLACLLMLTGLDFMTAVSGSATAIANVGPGLGEIIGPVGNFATLNDTAKWLLSIGMLVGRLELFTVLVLLLPRFWDH
jgi:trk system potassium uptake protein TrkH